MNHLAPLDIMKQPASEHRAYWVSVLDRLARPILGALSERKLRSSMPVETRFEDLNRENRGNCTHLEALARLLVGMAPWLELDGLTGDEQQQREHYADLARRAIDAATDPLSPDKMNFGAPPNSSAQALVDTAFLAQAIIRAPIELWRKQAGNVKRNVAAALVESRQIKPGMNNWLLFSATVDAALAMIGERSEPERIDFAIRHHVEWYKGDGVYGDGPDFHWDYYNSFVIQPMLIDVLRIADPDETGRFGMTLASALNRSKRYAAVLERLISPEGALPPIGRSLTYRIGALQTLAQMGLLSELDANPSPAQARCAMTASIHRLMDAPGTFDDGGWLRIGFCGAQPGLGEPYISTGSLYLCSAGLLPLGLSPQAPFWSDPGEAWTSLRIYSGDDVEADHAIMAKVGCDW